LIKIRLLSSADTMNPYNQYYMRAK